MPNTHSRLSPSSAARWMVCHGSVREEAKFPEPPSGEAAVAGTHTHTLLEYCLKTGSDPMLAIDSEMEDHEGTFKVTFEQAVRVMKAVVHVRERTTELGTVAVHTESRVNYGYWFGREDLYGTCDIALIGDKVIEIIDYKDGHAPVSPEKNHQMALYAAGKLAEFHVEGKPLPFETVRLTIIQPRAGDRGMEVVRSWDTTVDWVLNFIQEAALAAKATDDPDAPLVPGEVQCKWCRAKPCSAMTAKALGDIEMGFANMEVAQQAADKEPNAMTDDQLREFIEAIPLLRQTMVAAEEEAKRRFESGHKIPGLKAVAGRGSRNWAYGDDEMAEKLKKMGIPKSSIFTSKLVSPAQAKKLVWEKRDGSKKTLSQRQLTTLHKDYIKKTPGKITIVPESDEREEVTLGASEMFGAIEPQTEELPAWLAGVS